MSGPITALAGYPLITTDRLTDVRTFYVDELDFSVVFEASWFLLVAAPGEGSPTIAFMHPGHPSAPPGPEAFSGQGVIWTIQVEDAAEAYDAARRADLAIHHELTDEPWGQRRFMLRDPASLLLDIVEQTDPEPGFWERSPGPASDE